MANFLAELKRRNVFKVATIYVVISWLLLQVVDTIFPVFDIPMWASRLVVILLGIGFPVAVLMAWAFDLTPEGIQWVSEEGEHHVHTHAWDWVLGILLVVVIALVVVSEINNWRKSNVQIAERVRNTEAPVDETEATSGGSSIAVLPFRNMSGDPENEYFSDGMSEEILNLLAKIPELKVIGRTSSFAFKGKNEDLRIIGRALGVTTLLEGSVRKSGDRIRITAQLIDAANGSHIWSETYDRTMTDVFAVQDDVAAAIIGALQIHVGVSPSRGRPTENSDAYSLFLKARAAVNNYDWRGAEALLFQAIELDSDFAEAHELLAYGYWRAAGGQFESAEAQGMTGEAAAMALASNPDLVLAKVLHQIGDLENYSLLREIEALESATLYQPDNQLVLDMLFFTLFKAGYLSDALTIAERLFYLDPLSPNANSRLPAVLFASERIDDGFVAMERFEQLDVGRRFWYAGEALLAHGQDAAAITQFEETLEWEGHTDTDWVADLVTHARDSATGQEYLDRRIADFAAPTSVADPTGNIERRLIFWYLFFGFHDRYFDEIFDHKFDNSRWSDVDNLITKGIAYPALGFTAHPRYLEVADALGFLDLWESRGPPDFCEKLRGNWVCK